MIRVPASRSGIADATSEQAEARRSIRALTVGISFAGVAILAIVVAMATTWYAPRAIPAVVSVVDEDGTRWCGSVSRVVGGVAAIQTQDGVVRVDLATIQSMAAVTECS